MKKRTVMIFCVAFSMLLTGCGEASSSEDDHTRPNAAVKWFDCLHGDDMIWDGVREYQLDEFPGVTFRCHAEQLEAVTGKEILPLYDGMPIWSVYFYDLTGDGNPELCSTLSFGSGIVDDRVMIYDYADSVSYMFEERGEFDYVLNMQDGTLIVEKRAYLQGELVESGELVFLDGTIQIKTE